MRIIAWTDLVLDLPLLFVGDPAGVANGTALHARCRYVHPKVGKEAAAVLQSFYLELRQKHRSPDSTPITTRQIESLVRLSEARARLALREEVTAEDAHDVVEIMQCSMIDTVSDEFGVLDFDRSQHGSGTSATRVQRGRDSLGAGSWDRHAKQAV